MSVHFICFSTVASDAVWLEEGSSTKLLSSPARVAIAVRGQRQHKEMHFQIPYSIPHRLVEHYCTLR